MKNGGDCREEGATGFKARAGTCWAVGDRLFQTKNNLL